MFALLVVSVTFLRGNYTNTPQTSVMEMDVQVLDATSCLKPAVVRPHLDSIRASGVFQHTLVAKNKSQRIYCEALLCQDFDRAAWRASSCASGSVLLDLWRPNFSNKLTTSLLDPRLLFSAEATPSRRSNKAALTAK